MTESVAAALVLVSTVGCLPRTIAVSPREIHSHVKELRDKGHAKVEVEHGGTYTLTMRKTLFADFKGAKKRRKFSVDQLVANCPDFAPFREGAYRRDLPCLLMETTSASIAFGSRWEWVGSPDAGTFGYMVFGIVGIAAAVVVTAYINEASDRDTE